MRSENLQKLLKISYDHVIKQGRPSVDKNNCKYRSPTGDSCAAAPFIKTYNPDMENKVFIKLPTNSLGKEAQSLTARVFISKVLQSAHDKAARGDGDFINKYKQLLEQNINKWNSHNPFNQVSYEEVKENADATT